MPHRPREHHRIYKRQYGHGFGSFLKNTLKSTAVAAKAGLKTVGKLAKSGAKSVAKAAATHLAPIAKDLVHQGIAAAKEVGKEALGTAIEGAKEIAAKQAQQLVTAIATADNMDDVKKAFSEGAKEFKQDIRQLGKTVVTDAKSQAKHHAKQIAINGITQTLGMPTVEVPMDATASEIQQAAIDAQDEMDQDGEGIKHKRNKKSATLSELLAKADIKGGRRPKKTVSKPKQKGGAAFLPGTAAMYA
jgi:hypothetical protein